MTVYLMGFCSAYGAWFALEHPADRGPPVPSLFNTDHVRVLVALAVVTVAGFNTNVWERI